MQFMSKPIEGKMAIAHTLSVTLQALFMKIISVGIYIYWNVYIYTKLHYIYNTRFKKN
jgi:hypothetical protein